MVLMTTVCFYKQQNLQHTYSRLSQQTLHIYNNTEMHKNSLTSHSHLNTTEHVCTFCRHQLTNCPLTVTAKCLIQTYVNLANLNICLQPFLLSCCVQYSLFSDKICVNVTAVFGHCLLWQLWPCLCQSNLCFAFLAAWLHRLLPW